MDQGWAWARLADPVMAELSLRLKNAISTLPDDNLIKRSSTSQDQQIAFFAVYGSLDSPSFQ